jgi:hypothetical protein
MAKIICCDKCKSTNVEEIETEYVEIGYHWKETFSILGRKKKL